MTKVFHELPGREQDAIRRKYKEECSKSYKYSIHLFILYVILGILSVLGLLLVSYNFILGLLVFTISFILLIVVLYFLKLSNRNFIKYLKKNNMIYDKRNVIL